MPFERFVESGRVAYISEGPYQGKLAAIVDVIDQNRVLIDGPASGIPRGQIRLSQLHLTKFCIKFPYTGSTRVVRKAWEKAQLDEKWSQTMWARKVEAKKKRAALSDFDRFKLRKARQVRNKLRTVAFFTLKRAIKKKAKPTKTVAKTTKKTTTTKKPAKK